MGSIIPVPESSTPLDLVLGFLTHGQCQAMSASLQVFFKHCFCGVYSIRFCPTAGDITTCLCSFSQTPLPMAELDNDGDPWLKAKGDRDSLRGCPAVVWPDAVPLHGVSAPPTDFESLMAEFMDNPCRTPSHSPTPMLAGHHRPRPPPPHPTSFYILPHISYLTALFCLCFVTV